MTLSLIPKIHADHPDGRLGLVARARLNLALLASGRARNKSRRGHPDPLSEELQHPLLWQAVQAPEGPLAARAWGLARAHQPAWLINHGLRTYAWAQAFAVIGALRPDREVLYAAAMLHDAGLTPAAATPAEHCFAVRGARYARQALAAEASADRVEHVAEAIARHLDLQVHLHEGVEAHLLQAGAMVDVLGRGLQRVPADLREQVLQAHPRLQMKEALCRCMTTAVQGAPHSRAACYVRRLDFLRLIREAPFDE